MWYEHLLHLLHLSESPSTVMDILVPICSLNMSAKGVEVHCHAMSARGDAVVELVKEQFGQRFVRRSSVRQISTVERFVMRNQAFKNSPMHLIC